MAVTKQQKEQILAELVEKFKKAHSIGFSATNEVSVGEFDTLRANLRSVNATYNLAKKTLIKKAVKDALGIDIELSTLEGQIGVVCSNEDAIAGLSKVNDFVKSSKEEKITWAGSIIEWELKNAEETKVIAGMPSKETLLGRLVGSMKSPISALARFLDAAAKEVEAQGKDTVGNLEVSWAKAEAPKEVVAEAPAPEVKEEVVAEAPVEDKKEEPKAE